MVEPPDEARASLSPDTGNEVAGPEVSRIWPVVVTAVVIGVLIVAGAAWQLRQQENTNRRALEDTLSASHVNTLGALSSWFTRVEGGTRDIVEAESAGIRDVLASVPSTGAAPIDITTHEALRLEVTARIVERTQSALFVVLDPGGIVRMSSDEAQVGLAAANLSPALLDAASRPPLLQAFEPPRSAAGPEREPHGTIDIAASILGPGDQIAGILVIRHDPRGEFTEILQRGRVGESGETYAVNLIGDLASLSRFDGQLFFVGLVASGESGFLTVAIRDPGGDLTGGFNPDVPRRDQPLTKMAESVLGGESSLDLNGYRDYRGVPVVGVWTWDSRHELGFTTEMDLDEALEPIRQARQAAYLGTGVTLLLILVLVMVFVRNRRAISAANQALDEALATVRRLMGRMQEELNVGRDIQMSMLPLEFPAFPRRHEFDIHAALEAAREVGGDFYDMFLIDDNHLCFVVGDVSGKGVPAALFMAVSKTLIKSHAGNDLSPASIITSTNGNLVENNESSMFVTIFLCILNIETGKLTYTNAGHNPPYVKTDDGRFITLDQRHGPVAGAVGGVAYREDSIQLSPGDQVVLFTDGVTEAMNPDRELYSEARLEALLEGASLVASADTVDLIFESVATHAGTAEQSDDITILAMEFRGRSATQIYRYSVAIPNRLEEIGPVLTGFDEFATAHMVEDSVRRPVLLVLDDLVNNIVSYGFPDGEEGEIEITVEISPHRIAVTIIDRGFPFNPFTTATPVVSGSIDERAVGGLGTHLAMTLMDEYDYNRRGGRNVVTMVKHLAADDTGTDSEIPS